MFSLRQGKRVFGLITGGEVVASILSFLSVPFLLKLINTEQLLFISGATLLIGFFVLLYIVKKFNVKLSDIKEQNVQKKPEGKRTPWPAGKRNRPRKILNHAPAL